jgi:hypothetical protein
VHPSDLWIPLLHEIGIIIAAVAAAIAAVSSLKNGRTLNGHIKPKVDRLAIGRPRKKKTSKDGSVDWHTPVDLK